MSDLSSLLYGSLNSDSNEIEFKPNEFTNFLDHTQPTTLQSIESLFKPNGQPKFIDPRFQGQHAVWSRFSMLADGYTCKECEVIYPNSLKKFTPPPSTTVAMRHMREKHPEIAKQIEDEERERKASKGISDRKRASTASPNSVQSPAIKIEKTVLKPRLQPKISMLQNKLSMPLYGIEMFEPLQHENDGGATIEPVIEHVTPLDLDNLKAMHTSDSSYEKSQLIKENIAEILSVPQFSIEMLSHPKMQKLLRNLDPNVHFPSTSRDFYSVLKQSTEKKIQKTCQLFENLPWRLNISYHIFHADNNMEYVSATAFSITPKGHCEKYFLGIQKIDENGVHEALLQILHKYGLEEVNIFQFITSGSFSPSILSRAKNFNDHAQNDFEEIFEKTEINLQNLDLENLQKEIGFERNKFELLQKPLLLFEYALEFAIQNAIGTKNNGALITMLQLAQNCQSSLAKLYLKTSCQKWIPFPKLNGWGSIVVILNLFLKFKKQIFELAEQKSWTVPTTNQMSFLEELHQILYPFLNIFYKIHINPGTNSIPISHVYSSVKYFIYALDARMAEKKGDAKVMCFILLEQLKNKFNYIIDPLDVEFEPLYLIAALLDPNFSHTVDQATIGRISEEIYKMLRSNFPLNNNNSLSAITTVAIKSEPVTPQISSEFDLPADTNPYLQSLFQTCQNIPMPSEKSPPQEISPAMDPTRLGIQSYVGFALKNRTQNIDPIKFWIHCDPNFAPIKSLAIEILSLPSAITEFSCTIDSILFQNSNDLENGLLNDKLILYLNNA